VPLGHHSTLCNAGRKISIGAAGLGNKFELLRQIRG